MSQRNFIARTAALLLLVLCAGPASAVADSFTVAWNPVADAQVVGYYVYIGTSSGTYTSVVDVGQTTQYTYDAAVAGSTYYVTVAAYAAGALVGPRAPELVATTRGSAPMLANPGSRASLRGTAVKLTLPASDPDGDALTFTASGLPPGMSIGATTGLISGTPGSAGTFTVSVTARDTTGKSSTQSFVWSVLNTDAAPSVNIAAPAAATAFSSDGQYVTLNGVATDDIGVSSVTWANDRGGSGVAAGTSNWSAVVPLKTGANVLTVTATDTAKKTVSATITLNTTPPAPTAPAPTDPASTPLKLTSLTADKPSPQFVGMPIRLQATVTGGTAPYEYLWWVVSGSSMVVLRDWSSASSIVWTPTAAGSAYELRVSVRTGGSTSKAVTSGGMPFKVSEPAPKPLRAR